jgi:hypothetical protein
MRTYPKPVVSAFRTAYAPESITDDPPTGFNRALDLLQAADYMSGCLWAGSDKSFEDLTELAFPDQPRTCRLVWIGRPREHGGRRVWRCAQGPAHRHSLLLRHHNYVER